MKQKTWLALVLTAKALAVKALTVNVLALRILAVAVLLVTACSAAAQECTTTVLVSFYDQLTKNEIETLKTGDIEVTVAGKTVPRPSATRDFNNRVLVLVETDGAAKNDRVEEVVDMVTRQARQADEGKPVAFGMFAEKALFTKTFLADPEKRTSAINGIVEEAGSLGKRVALWDALHQALGLFGPHQPGDTVLLIGEPYDDASHHSAGTVEKEFIASGTRLFMMRRSRSSRVERDFLWSSHEFEKTLLDRMTRETGGLWSEYVASLIRFAWAGYLLEIKLPPGMNKPMKWKVQFHGTAAQTHRKTNFYYPALLPPCAAQSER
ncbi:MAG: hypothetical protein LAO78_20960 [Acidobacteriia bacterium]|nr:hypothetical protein [Terriglobia bacterium]